MKRIFKRIFGRRNQAIISAIVTTVVLGVIFQTQNVLSRLGDIGAEVSFSQRLSMTAYDVFYLGKPYAILVAIALLISIIVCDLIVKYIQFARPLIYAIGGAVAILVLLFAMKMKFFDIHILAGARDGFGIAMQMLAGSVGGIVFSMISRPETKA